MVMSDALAGAWVALRESPASAQKPARPVVLRTAQTESPVSRMAGRRT
jgi:hypothetical protein